MIVYFDSSSIVKWFFDEKGCDASRSIRDQADAAVTSIIAFPEVLSAFNRAKKDRRCSTSDFDTIRKQFSAIWPQLTWIWIDSHLVEIAGKLIFEHDLRGFDAVHFASALVMAEPSKPLKPFFSCFDDKLNQAAQKLGFETHNRPF